MTYLLWFLQAVLALLFLFAGTTKFIMSVDQMNAQSNMPLPGLLIHFIGLCEILGGLGLILPWLLKIRPGLTPLAAIGLAIIMLGAVIITIAGGDIVPAIFPFVVGLLLVFIAYGRSKLTPAS